MKFGEISIVKIFFAVSVVTFFVIFTVYVLNLAQGRTITRQGEVVNTSILRVNSNPEDVNILVNGKELPIIENRIEGIQPGIITVSISKEGFTTWEKTININPSTVKDIYVQLFPNDLNLEQFTNSNVDTFTYASDARYIYYSILNPEIASDAGLYRQRLTRNLIDFGQIEPEKIADYSENLIDLLIANDYRLSVSDDNNRILLNIPSEQLLFSYNTNTLNERSNIASRLGFYPTNIMWHNGSSSAIVRNEGLIAEYFFDNNEIVVIDFDPNEETRYAKAGNKVFFIRSRENLLYEYENRTSELFTFPEGINIEGELNNIFAPNQNPDMFILSISGDFYVLDIEKEFFERIGRNIRILSIAPQGKTIIYRQGGEIYSYNLEEVVTQDAYEATTKEMNLTTNDYEKLFFSNSGANLIVFTIDDSGNRSLYFRDSDGQNPVAILSEELIVKSDVLLTNEADSLFVLLNDSNPIDEEISDEDTTSNIYKVDLEIIE